MKILPPCFAASLAIALAACTTPPPPPAAPAAPTAASAPVAPKPAKVDASAPIPKRGNARFYELHASFLKRAKEGPVGVLFLGDSITEGWGKAPEVWKTHYEKYQPANFGIGGDQTQHVIWRIEDGELDGIKPKVVVLMIGTNNTGGHNGAEIAAANEKIISLIHAKLPETKVLLLAIFPRGPRAKNASGVFADDGVTRMAAINDANTRIARLDNGSSVRFLNINSVFMDSAGKIPDAIMPDQLHPNAAGYQLWADAMQPLLDEMMR